MKGTKPNRPVLRAVSPPLLPELLTPAQVAEKLAICRATVYKLTTAGKLDHLRVGAQIRVPLAALAAYLAHRPKSEP
jgi:excisionase family DNA binding protein